MPQYEVLFSFGGKLRKTDYRLQVSWIMKGWKANASMHRGGALMLWNSFNMLDYCTGWILHINQARFQSHLSSANIKMKCGLLDTQVDVKIFNEEKVFFQHNGLLHKIWGPYLLLADLVVNHPTWKIKMGWSTTAVEIIWYARLLHMLNYCKGWSNTHL